MIAQGAKTRGMDEVHDRERQLTSHTLLRRTRCSCPHTRRCLRSTMASTRPASHSVESRMLIWNNGRGARPPLGAECRQRSERPGRNSGGAPVTGPGPAPTSTSPPGPGETASGRTCRFNYAARRTEPSGVDGLCALLPRPPSGSATGCRSARWCGRVIDVCRLHRAGVRPAPASGIAAALWFVLDQRTCVCRGRRRIARRVRRLGPRAGRACDVWVNDTRHRRPTTTRCASSPSMRSKGLEFPSSCSWDSTPGNRRSDRPVLWGDEGPEVEGGSERQERFETAQYDELWAAESAAFKAESVRLAYVRDDAARDRVVLSLFRPAPSNGTLARRSHHVAHRYPSWKPLRCPPKPRGSRSSVPRSTPPGSTSVPPGWRGARPRSRAWAVRPAVAATRIQHLAKAAVGADVEGEGEAEADDLTAGDEMPDGTTDEADERVDDEPPWRRGRAGTRSAVRCTRCCRRSISRRATARPRCSRAGRCRGGARPRGCHRAAGAVRARVSERQGGRRDRQVLARGVRGRAGRRAGARGLHRPALRGC